jgi:phosphoribosylformylglycinamidine synthase PurS subunit
MSNNMLAKVYVTPKKAILDPQGKAIANSLHELRYEEITDVRMGKYLELRLTGLARPQAEQRVEEMCRRLLANSVIEDFRFEIVEE